jgi:hypothetical protein
MGKIYKTEGKWTQLKDHLWEDRQNGEGFVIR